MPYIINPEKPLQKLYGIIIMVDGAGFEPAKAMPADLQSAPFDRSGIRPHSTGTLISVINDSFFLPMSYPPR